MDKGYKKLNPDYVKSVTETVNGCPYFKLLSIKIKKVGKGESLLEVALEEKHLQPFGVVHGGVYASLVDAAAFWAVYPEIDEEMGLTTVELKLNYLAPASEGCMIAKGKSIRVGKTLCLGEASIEDDTGTLLAHGTATMMILNDLKIQGEAAFPPKFET
ncbi:MAG: PaaI family thioesterase [Deltaproteobacteria bacterium]|nr:PaaI family thioesterase [Deltaproteobacteria bacterium]